MPEPTAEAEIRLFCAVGLNEAQDIEEFGGFRCRPGYGYEHGKWFAASLEDAIRWGQAFQQFLRPRPFRIVGLHVPRDFAHRMEYHDDWDAIGPAYYILASELAMLNWVGSVTILETVFDPEETR